MDDLFQTYGGLIASCAEKLCRRYGCPQLKDDLISVGNITLLEKALDYRPDSDASMATYLYPYLQGNMRREIEKSLLPFSLPKDQFEAHGFQWNSVFSSFDGPIQIEVATSSNSVEQQVLQSIYLSCMEQEFEKLSFKERQILGSFFGAYGYCKQTAADIAEEFLMTKNALLKAKNKALQKLRHFCEDNGLGIWKIAAATIREACCEYTSENSYAPPQQSWYM